MTPTAGLNLFKFVRRNQYIEEEKERGARESRHEAIGNAQSAGFEPTIGKFPLEWELLASTNKLRRSRQVPVMESYP